MRELPPPLAPLEENRRELLATLDLLDKTFEPVARADLASELVGICSRYEDVMDRVVYPAIRASAADGKELDKAEEDQQVVREALGEIRHRTQHVKPMNAHADDPEGFEQTIHQAVEVIRGQIDHEDQLFLASLAELDAETSEELRREVAHAVAHASTHPNPPHNLLGRAIQAVEQKIERNIQDESTSWHPGVDKLDDKLSEAATAEEGQRGKQ